MGYIVTAWLPDHEGNIKERMTKQPADPNNPLTKETTEKIRLAVKEALKNIDQCVVVYTVKEE